MAALLCALLSVATSAVDAYTLSKDVSEIMRFQHSSGGFHDAGREANAKDTLHAVWVSAVYGSFSYFDARQCFKWLQTLKNRDGGAGMFPGAKSSIQGTYYFFHMAALVEPSLVDGVRIIEFLKNSYDAASGLFKETEGAEPSMEATYYAYELLGKFRDTDLGWINTFAIRNLISDYLVDDHFELAGASPIKAQLWAGSVAKFISLTVPYHRVSEYVVAKVNQAIKEGKLDNEEAYAATKILIQFGDEVIPAALIQNLKTSGSLADLFYVTNMLVQTAEISKFFDVKVLMTSDNEMIDLENEGVTINSMVRPAVSITALGRFVNPLLKVNVTTYNGEEPEYQETLEMDYQTGLFRSNRITSVSKLGQLRVDVLAWFTSELCTPLTVQKSVRSHVSLPMDITCEARLTADEVIPVGGAVEPGTSFRVQIASQADENIELHESTMATIAISDAAGALLYHQGAAFKNQLEYVWQLPAVALPSGQLSVVIEVGDKVNGIHTHQAFEYKINNQMAATDIEVPEALKLSDVLRVKMSPALYANGEYVTFKNEKFIDGELVDAAGEVFYSQASYETQRYSMRVKVGGVVVKVVEGEVMASEDGKIVVDFESAVDENLDFATGFAIDFLFNAENTAPILLTTEQDVAVKISSNVVAEVVEFKKGAAVYGEKLAAEFKLKDEDSGKYLAAGRAYPVLAILNKDRQVLVEKKCKIVENGFAAKVQVSAAVPAEKVILAVMIRKGLELIPVKTAEGTLESEIVVNGKIDFQAVVRESGKYLVVDFTATVDEKKLKGTAFNCKIINNKGETVAVVPLAQEKTGSRLSWETAGHTGTYKLAISRVNDPAAEPLAVHQVSIDMALKAALKNLPVEGLTIALAFAALCFSIKLRMEMAH